jgi:hypothetical protein
MNLLIKYLPLIILLYHPKTASGTSYYEEPVIEVIIENPFQTGTYSDNIYSSYDSSVFAYEQNIRPYALLDEDGEDGFDDGGTDDPKDDYNDVKGVPTGDELLPLCLFIMVYSLWGRRQKMICR